MTNSIVDLLDTKYLFVILYSAFFTLFLSHLLNLGDEITFIFPNPILLIIIWLIGLYLISAIQEINHQDVSFKTILQWQILSIFPTTLVLVLLRKQIKSEINRNNDQYIIWSIRLIYIVFLVFTILLALVVIGILSLTGDFRIILIAVYSSAAFCGWSMGYYLSQITENPSPLKQWVLQYLIAPIIGTKKRRMLFVGFLTLILVIAMLLDFDTVFEIIEL